MYTCIADSENLDMKKTKNVDADSQKMSKFVLKNIVVREFLSECLGTFILIVYGLSSVAQYKFGGGTYGDFLSLSWAWGLAVCFAVYTTDGVSGGHINPSVTVALATVGKHPWKKVPHYLAGQYIGSFLGACVVYILYYDALNHYDGGVRSVTGPNATAMVWATYPNTAGGVGTLGAFTDQLINTSLLLLGISAIIDPRNADIPKYLRPFLFGFLVFMHVCTLTLNCGCAINPARDLSPRVFTAIAGWGSEVFTAGDYFFWIPIVGPHIGAVLGVWAYNLIIERHIPEAVTDLKTDVSLDNVRDMVAGVRECNNKPI